MARHPAEACGSEVSSRNAVLAGLVPAIHALPRVWKDVDARDKPGHDGEKQKAGSNPGLRHSGAREARARNPSDSKARGGIHSGFSPGLPRNDSGRKTSFFPPVTASEAKQSISPLVAGMDCFVAVAPRNDGGIRGYCAASTASSVG
ncbi:hypothetical protein CWO89_01200 [Bradyrhizobium sp. Leo170]|nr:hypothetical protein CWO89_01200 [Bradyrhizobium sp. Leo170]